MVGSFAEMIDQQMAFQGEIPSLEAKMPKQNVIFENPKASLETHEKWILFSQHGNCKQFERFTFVSIGNNTPLAHACVCILLQGKNTKQKKKVS